MPTRWCGGCWVSLCARRHRCVRPRCCAQVLHGPNQWPPEHLVPGFKSCMLTYTGHMQRLCGAIVSALADGLGLGPGAMEPLLQPHPYAMLRLLRYPPITGRGRTLGGESGAGAVHEATRSADSGTKVAGIGPHTDFGAVSVLLQDDCGGLQVMNAGGEWVDAPAVPGALVVNLGDMMQVRGSTVSMYVQSEC